MEFVAELRWLAVICEFGAYLSESLCDRLVCGLRNEAEQRRLHSEEDLTLTKAIELALSLEAAEKNAQQLKRSELCVGQVSQEVHIAQASQKARYCCGGEGHREREYWFKDTVSHNCGKKGHIRKVCQSKSQGKQTLTLGQGRSTGNTRWVNATNFECESSPGFPVLVVGRQLQSSKALTVRLTLDRVQAPME